LKPRREGGREGSQSVEEGHFPSTWKIITIADINSVMEEAGPFLEPLGVPGTSLKRPSSLITVVKRRFNWIENQRTVVSYDSSSQPLLSVYLTST